MLFTKIVISDICKDNVRNNQGNCIIMDRVAQSVTCLTADASLTAGLGLRVGSRPDPILSWRLVMK